jgi:alpha-glucuronidase
MKVQYYLLLFLLFTGPLSFAEDGYRLWLRYERIEDENLRAQYQKAISSIGMLGESPTLAIANKELLRGLSSILDRPFTTFKNIDQDGMIVIGRSDHPLLKGLQLSQKHDLADEGYLIKSLKINDKNVILVTADSDIGVLYGSFHLLRLLQMQQSLEDLNIIEKPALNLRMLNHWDNLDRTVERGYAGYSIWDWHRLPGFIPERYHDYARANASLGINATVLTNVNAKAVVLREDYLEKVKAIADVLRPYGIKVFLTARFNAPMELDGLSTADPLSSEVQQWWSQKIDQIYQRIPDFGGFLVKANSEGQPGPQNYGRSHAEGANMLAAPLSKYGGMVFWRAFVYSAEEPEDRAKQAYNEFVPLDGAFLPNVMVQVKNGPIDFQPREPVHPLFGAMPETPLMMEFQITQEYLGQATNLVFLASMYKEVLNFNTYVNSQPVPVREVIDGTTHDYSITGMAGVSNIGNERNWTGHLFGQANWYAFGRLAWNPELSAEEIAEEWLRQSFGNDEDLIRQLSKLLLGSYETYVRYTTPLGLHHIMGAGHHYGPGPWVSEMSRADWTSVYYHRADKFGIGFDRTASGSNAVGQYSNKVQALFSNRNKIPEKYLLWFHHVGWDEKLKDGRTLWASICYNYNRGVEEVGAMRVLWQGLENKIDEQRFREVSMLLKIQEQEACWWRDACVLYFQTFAQRPIPSELVKPANNLNYYKRLNFPYAPGN